MGDRAALPDQEPVAGALTTGLDSDEPTLYLVATPIGNLEDITLRALRILRAVDVVACEDTRRTRKLLTHFDIAGKRLIACHDHNEENSAQGIVKLLGEGLSVALCSDGGMPVVNDPGFRVVDIVRDAGFPVTVLPGASSVTTALALSGLPPDRFVFVGYPPRKAGRRRRWLAEIADLDCTAVLLESPHRLPEFLADALTVYGDDAEAAVCIELTKRFEETVRGALSELVERFTDPPKGEVTVVLGASTRDSSAGDGGSREPRSRMDEGDDTERLIGGIPYDQYPPRR